jgi:glyoxylase-like metal-dependent hydrolase (beta-lactamase superfamily II)
MSQIPDLKLKEIIHPGVDRRVRIFRHQLEVDAYVIKTDRYLVIVDTYATPELALELIETVKADLADRQLLVINTHGDWDHFWGNRIFSPSGPYPAIIVAHEAMLTRLREEAVTELNNYKSEDATRYQNVELVAPHLTFSDRLQLQGGDLTLELLPTPGHTPDHVCIWIPEIKLVIAADAIEKPIPAVGGDTTITDMRQSFQRIKSLNADWILPSHGGTCTPELLQRNIAYFDHLETQVKAAFVQGQVPEDWADRADLPNALNLAFEDLIDPAELPDENASPFAGGFYRECHFKAVKATVATTIANAQNRIRQAPRLGTWSEAAAQTVKPSN